MPNIGISIPIIFSLFLLFQQARLVKSKALRAELIVKFSLNTANCLFFSDYFINWTIINRISINQP